MKVDPSLIKAEREKRAWSQEQLARVSGLGLRTIQRIEKAGAASFESAKALAAVFEVDVATLHADELGTAKVKAALPGRPLLGAAAVLLTGSGGLFVTASEYAEIAFRETSLALNAPPMIDASAGAAPTNPNDDLCVVLVPKVEPDGTVRLGAQLFALERDRWVLVSEPKLVTADGREAEIRLADDTGRAVRFLVSPQSPKPPSDRSA